MHTERPGFMTDHIMDFLYDGPLPPLPPSIIDMELTDFDGEYAISTIYFTPVSFADGYIVRIASEIFPELNIDSTDSIVENIALAPCHTYTVSVVAFNQHGSSTSDIYTFKPIPEELIPEKVSISRAIYLYSNGLSEYRARLLALDAPWRVSNDELRGIDNPEYSEADVYIGCDGIGDELEGRNPTDHNNDNDPESLPLFEDGVSKRIISHVYRLVFGPNDNSNYDLVCPDCILPNIMSNGSAFVTLPHGDKHSVRIDNVNKCGLTEGKSILIGIASNEDLDSCHEKHDRPATLAKNRPPVLRVCE